MQINGTYFDGKSARAHDADMHVSETGLRIVDDSGRMLFETEELKTGIHITPGLGKTKRIIRFAGGPQFETGDNTAVAALEKKLGVNQPLKIVGVLESRWPAVLACFAGMAIFIYAAVVFGLPAVAKVAAFKIPVQTVNNMSRDALAMFDKRFFKPSALSEGQKARVYKDFWAITKDLDASYGYRLEFRQSKALGANAFALPSGVIIVTDALIETAEDPREIQGVLVHELAHITRRHALRSVIQNTGVVLLISLLAGDVTSITSFAASIPTLLVESDYSRRFETEADEAVARYFAQKGWPVQPYVNILIRITAKDPNPVRTDILSSHPEIEKRVAHLKKMFPPAVPDTLKELPRK